MKQADEKRSTLVVLPSLTLRQDWRFLLLILLCGAALRLDFLIANNFTIDADEAIVGLMAKHISEFRDLPTFYYGQHYLGSLESILAAILFLFAGVSSVALKCVPLLASLLLIVLVYQLGLEFRNRSIARVSALLIALPPQMLVIWSGMARGGFVELVCIGTAALIMTVRWLRLDRPEPKLSAWIGVILGLGWWVNNQILYFMLPIGLFMLVALLRSNASGAKHWPALGRHLSWGLGGFFVGGLPFWIYNIRKPLVSFGIAKRGTLPEIWQHLQGLLDTAMPIILGGERQWQRQEFMDGAVLLAYVLFLVPLAAVLFMRRREVRKLLCFKIDTRTPLELLLLTLLSIFAIFCISSFGSLNESPRYLLPAYVPLALLVGTGITILMNREVFVGVLVLVGVLGLNILSCYLGGRALPGEPFVFAGQRVAKDHSELLAWFKQNNITAVRTNYWIGYRLAFETKEQVRFSMFREPYSVRISEYEEYGEKLGRNYLPLVLVPAQAVPVRRALAIEGISFSEHKLSGYVVLSDLTPVSQHLITFRQGLSASASVNAGEAGQGIDGSVATRWSSAHPQTPDMRYAVSLATPKVLRGLSYDLGGWVHDEPTDLSIELELADGSHQMLLKQGDYSSIKFYRDRDSSMLFAFPPTGVRRVTLSQLGSQVVFDWSIAELQLYE